MPVPSALSGKEHAALGRVLLLVCALLLALVGPIADAHAKADDDPPRAVFALEALETDGDPPYFVLDARPGETITRSVRVVNTGKRAGTARLYAVDATTGQTTGAVYRGPRDPRRGVGGWVTLEDKKLRLAPGQSRSVALSVTVPEGARDGQHLGGIVAENAALTRGPTREREEGSFRVDVRSLTVVAVQVNLPGPAQERMAITGVRPAANAGRQTLLVGLRNFGNQMVKGRGELVISDERGERLKRASFVVDTFVPQTAVADPIAVPDQALPAGTYSASVTLRYGDGQVARLTAPFTISDKQVQEVFGSSPQAPPGASGLPLFALILGGLALLVGGFLAALVLGRRRGSVPAIATPTTPGSDRTAY
jgi:hypothetical protein